MGVEVGGWHRMAGRYLAASKRSWQLHDGFCRCQCRTSASFVKEADYYHTLDVDSRATHAEIKKSYYKLSKIYHPDRHHGSQDAAQKFREVSEAYEVLGNSKLRRLYDRGLLHTADGYRHFRGPRAPAEPPTSSSGRQPGTRGKSGRAEMKSSTPPMSGRTQFYDFDAWQESHYSEMVSRRARASVKYDRMMRARQGVQFKTEVGLYLVVGAVLVALMVYAAGIDSDLDSVLASAREAELKRRAVADGKKD